MLITIENEKLSLTVNTLGAQMMNLVWQGEEYLWQGDPKYWNKRAPILFPFVGRLTDKQYTVFGERYNMGNHGFASVSEFHTTRVEKDELVLVMESNNQTLTQYPFAFRFAVTYRLNGNTVDITYTVENRSDRTMPFGVGGHPGFGIPHAQNESIADYYLEFSQTCLPDKICLSNTGFITGHDVLCPLDDGRVLPLDASLFTDNTVLLKNMAKAVTLKSRKSEYSVTVSYPDLPYLGLWPWPNATGAPYICIEPWSSVPARQDVLEDLNCKSDMIALAPNKTYETTWSITIGGKH